MGFMNFKSDNNDFIIPKSLKISATITFIETQSFKIKSKTSLSKISLSIKSFIL